jgi:hypothetical protein
MDPSNMTLYMLAKSFASFITEPLVKIPNPEVKKRLEDAEFVVCQRPVSRVWF